MNNDSTPVGAERPKATGAEPVLSAKGVSKWFPIKGGLLRREKARLIAVNDVTIEVGPGETLGLVGESGSGKSTLARCLVRLYAPDEGNVLLHGRDISKIEGRELRKARSDVQYVFQDPGASLDPRFRVGDIVAEGVESLRKLSRTERAEIVAEALAQVGLDPSVADRFPHEFSGGQRQRIGIARALALNPSVIIADEPVSALDVSVQSQILNLFVEIQKRLGVSYVFITHDLAVVGYISDRVAVMYLGTIVEEGTADQILHSPQHPYTKALTSAAPVMDPNGKPERIVLQGEIPSPMSPPSGCRFRTRCPIATDVCATTVPALVVKADGRKAACHFVD